MTHWLNLLCEYWNDKKLAEKCGLEVEDICVHESDGKSYTVPGCAFYSYMKCKKCGEFYR